MGADIAFLQEAGQPPSGLDPSIKLGCQARWEPWKKRHYGWFIHVAAVARLSDRVELDWFKRVLPSKEPEYDEIPVSGMGTVAAARVRERDSDREPFFAVSMSTEWLTPHPSTGSKWGSAIRTPRPIGSFRTCPRSSGTKTHRLTASWRRATSTSSTARWTPTRTRSRPGTARSSSGCVRWASNSWGRGTRRDGALNQRRRVCCRTPRMSRLFIPVHTGEPPAKSAWNQLDYVFASKGFHESVIVRAMNGVDEWGPSDHCRLLIEIK